MRHNLRFSMLLMFVSCGITICSTAQFSAKKICFDDGFGYRFEFTNITVTGVGTLYAEGTTSGYPGGRATLLLDFTAGISNGKVEVHSINVNPDNCTSYSDSFVYVGSAVIVRTDGKTESYSGSGTWISYCYGSPLNSGTWYASGPCKANAAKPVFKGPAPADSKSKATGLMVKPNPLQNTSVVSYKTSAPGKVNITIYDYMHRPVKVLVNESKSAGEYSVSWNGLGVSGSRVPSGLYKVVAVTNEKITTTTLQVL